jgi:hypothetical protein
MHRELENGLFLEINRESRELSDKVKVVLMVLKIVVHTS